MSGENETRAENKRREKLNKRTKAVKVIDGLLNSKVSCGEFQFSIKCHLSASLWSWMRFDLVTRWGDKARRSSISNVNGWWRILELKAHRKLSTFMILFIVLRLPTQREAIIKKQLAHHEAKEIVHWSHQRRFNSFQTQQINCSRKVLRHKRN